MAKLNGLINHMGWEDAELMEAWPDFIIVTGIAHKYGFRRTNINEHREEIKAFLLELPEEFHSDKGDIFFKGVATRDGGIWGNHFMMEVLMCLGMAANMIKWAVPREQWKYTPQIVPSVIINVNGF